MAAFQHLIHVGYAKTGSTLLQHWFGEHPQIAFSISGIGGFDSVYDLVEAGAAAGPGALLRVTSCEALSSPRSDLKFDGVVDYGRLAADNVEKSPVRACETLHSLFPGARVLIVTRGFRSMILSSYSEYVRSSGELGLLPFVESAAARGAWDYDSLIAHYAERFGPGNLIVLPYELLRDDPQAFVRRIEGELGLDHRPLPQGAMNPSLSADRLIWYPRLTRLIGRLPVGSRLRGRILTRHVASMMDSRLGLLTSLLQRFRPRPEVTGNAIPEALLDRFTGRADRLRERPVYTPYLDDYLIRR